MTQTAMHRATAILNAVKAEFLILTKDEAGNEFVIKSDSIDTRLPDFVPQPKISASDYVRANLKLDMVVGEVAYIPASEEHPIETIRSVALMIVGKHWGKGAAVTTVVDGEKIDIDDQPAKRIEIIRVK
jgi:hypothetical protein